MRGLTKWINIHPTAWVMLAQNRSTWHGLIDKGCRAYEVRRNAETQHKDELQKSRAICATNAVSTHFAQHVPGQSSWETPHLLLVWLMVLRSSLRMMMNKHDIQPSSMLHSIKESPSQLEKKSCFEGLLEDQLRRQDPTWFLHLFPAVHLFTFNF